MKNIFKHLFKKKHPNVVQIAVHGSDVNSDIIQAGRDIHVNGFGSDLNIEHRGSKTKIRVEGNQDSVEVRKGIVYINGQPVVDAQGDKIPAKEVAIYVSGNIQNVWGNPKLVMADTITGRVETMGNVDCQGNIEGNVDTTGSITCRGDINGDVNSDGSVVCAGNVSGSIQTNGSLSFRR